MRCAKGKRCWVLKQKQGEMQLSLSIRERSIFIQVSCSAQLCIRNIGVSLQWQSAFSCQEELWAACLGGTFCCVAGWGAPLSCFAFVVRKSASGLSWNIFTNSLFSCWQSLAGSSKGFLSWLVTTGLVQKRSWEHFKVRVSLRKGQLKVLPMTQGHVTLPKQTLIGNLLRSH